eukprot:SAG25_NODE_4495_length_803_cov_0.411932_1_plen_104_part_00
MIGLGGWLEIGGGRRAARGGVHGAVARVAAGCRPESEPQHGTVAWSPASRCPLAIIWWGGLGSQMANYEQLGGRLSAVFFNESVTTEIYTKLNSLALHHALPI